MAERIVHLFAGSTDGEHSTVTSQITLCCRRPAIGLPGGDEGTVERDVATCPGRTTSDAALADEGRRLASQREDLIAQGVDPADLLIPLHPDANEPWRSNDEWREDVAIASEDADQPGNEPRDTGES